MTTPRNDVYLENGGAFLFTVELTSIPETGSVFEYTPVGSSVVKYKIEKVIIKVEEFFRDPGPPNPEVQGFAQSVRIDVSLVP